MYSSTAQRFRAKPLAHADSVRFADTGLRPNPQPDSYRDPERSDADQSQSDADSNPNSHSDPNAIVSRSECHTNTYANTRVLETSCWMLSCKRVKVSFTMAVETFRLFLCGAK